MNKKTISSLLLSCLCIASLAQGPESHLDRDVGFNVAWIFQGIFNSAPVPFSVRFKKLTGENRALRIGIEIQFDWFNNAVDGAGTTYMDGSSATLGVAVGKEFLQPIDGTKWVWYFGGDIEPFYRFENISHYSAGQEYLETDYDKYGVNARPFIGVRFDINPRLYVSTEACVMVSYARLNNRMKYFNAQTPDTDIGGSEFSFSIPTMMGVFMAYRF